MKAVPIIGTGSRYIDHVGARALVGGLAAVVFLLAGHEAFPADKKTDRKTDKETVFEVPTTGTIEDVMYRPEFDEWWVKCREGGNIAVYTYDRRTKKWAQVLFTARAPEPKPAKTEQPPKGTSQLVPDVGAKRPKTETEEPPGQPKVQPKREADQPPKPARTKWWDPLNLLKSGERFMFPPGWERK